MPGWCAEQGPPRVDCLSAARKPELLCRLRSVPVSIARARSPSAHARLLSALYRTHQNSPTGRNSQLVVRLLLILVAGTAHAAVSAALAVVLGDDRGADALHLLVLLLDLLSVRLRIGVQPGLALLEGIHDLLLLAVVLGDDRGA